MKIRRRDRTVYREVGGMRFKIIVDGLGGFSVVIEYQAGGQATQVDGFATHGDAQAFVRQFLVEFSTAAARLGREQAREDEERKVAARAAERQRVDQLRSVPQAGVVLEPKACLKCGKPAFQALLCTECLLAEQAAQRAAEDVPVVPPVPPEPKEP